MRQISWRHHYIPQFYLKGFTSPNNTFKIYDVEKKCFLKNGKEFSSESFFFEKHSNTLFSESAASDFLEESYKTIESKTANIFNKIHHFSVTENYNLNDLDIALLQYFIGIMYWRIPANREKLKKIITEKDLSQLGLTLESTNGSKIEKEELVYWQNTLKKNPNFAKGIKFLYPSIFYKDTFECKTPLHILSFPDGLPKICSDNPVLYENTDSFNIYTDDIIFPINSTKVFIRAKDYFSYSIGIKVLIDLLTYKQARKYVSCTDVNYIEMLENLYQNRFSNVDELRNCIFSLLIKR